jgi:ribulose-5-phosphate 4-epimerase/fuculose-1-phosphate aldolase
MQEEGVIKFDLEFTAAAASPVPGLEELNAWRCIFRQLGLIGQDPARYGGCGFGNISRRLPPYDAARSHPSFVISGSQTGHLAELSSAGFATVSECDAERNRVVASGPIRPSSESLTHGAVYNVRADIRIIFHVHSPTIWRRAALLGLPVTDPMVLYGTPAMAREVARKIDSGAGVLVMGGHEDGVIAFGHTADEAGTALMRALVRSYSCGNSNGVD